MAEIKLDPISINPDDYDDIRVEIIRTLKEMMYGPLMREAGQELKGVQNDSDALIAAIKAGRITYFRGKFKGRFSATLSRELRRLGAEWDRTLGMWMIPQSKMPMSLRRAIALSEITFKKKLSKIDTMLKELSPADIAESMVFTKHFDSALFKVDKKFEDNVKKITIAPKLTEKEAEKISREYSKNMQLYIQDFTKQEIKNLRDDISARAMKGERYEGMIEEIQKSYGVSHSKAKFLARQETSLLMAKFAETRYQSVGIDDYIWTCVAGSSNHPVRPSHKRLNGTRQKFSDPPVVNDKGERKNPGQDYGCRCKARPIVKF